MSRSPFTMNRRSPSGPRISWQEPVEDFADLPLDGNEDGDVRITTATDEIWIWDGAAWVPPTGLGTDERVKVSAADTTPGYLSDKLPTTSNVATSIGTPGGNEDLLLSVVGVTESAGPTSLSLGAIPADSFLKRVGASIVGIPGGGASTIWVKDPVASFAALPLVGNTAGDIRVTLDSGYGYVWDGARWTSIGGANPSQFSRECDFFEDFLAANGTNIGATGWFGSTSGAGTNAVVGTTLLDGSHQGILSQQTGSTATGRSSVLQNGLSYSNVGASGGVAFAEWLCNFGDALSGGGQDYTVMYGYSDSAGGAGFGANAALLTHDPAISATNWVARSIVGGVSTTTNTGIAIAAAGTWQKLGVVLSSTGAVYTIDGVVGASHAAAALPLAGVGWAPIVKIQKTLGNTQRRLRTDYCAWGYRLSAPR